MTWLRETPYNLCYYSFLETSKRIQGNDLGHSKNAKDWAIRRRVPNADMIGNGTVSETAKASVFNEGLINLRMLKVQSSLLGNKEGMQSHGAALLIPTKRFISLCVLQFYKNKILFSVSKIDY